jgi:hypothetical protein
MHIVCYVLHAQFDVLTIIHVILLNIPDNYDKRQILRAIRNKLYAFYLNKKQVRSGRKRESREILHCNCHIKNTPF